EEVLRRTYTVDGEDAARVSPMFQTRDVLTSPQGEQHEPRGHESLQFAGTCADVRFDPHLACQPGKDSVLVFRRDQEAGDDQLPYVQARTRRSFLRAYFRTDQGLRVPVRQVQAHEVQGRHLREVRR